MPKCYTANSDSPSLTRKGVSVKMKQIKHLDGPSSMVSNVASSSCPVWLAVGEAQGIISKGKLCPTSIEQRKTGLFVPLAYT